MNIKLGPAGSGGNTLKGVEHVKEIGLQAMEVEFVRGVHMSNELAKEVGKLAEKLKIELSVHAPYFINLNSAEKEKREASKKRIIVSCERASHLGAKIVVFHAGYYGKMSKEETFDNICEAIKDITSEIKKRGYDVKLAPETMGKVNVFGKVDEIKKLMRETGCKCCVDFAHIKALNHGKIDYNETLNKFSGDLHCHFSGIEYGEKGEKNHKITPSEEIHELSKAVLKSGKRITIINESPNPVGDSIRTKKEFEKLGYKFN